MKAFDTRALEADLRARVEGEVRFDAASRALHASGGSLYRQVPIGLVIPATVDDAVEAVAVCRDHDAPVLPLGADTSLAGQSTNVAVAIDFSKRCNRILEVDPDRRLASVEPGVVLDDLRAAAAPHGLTFGPDPATHAWCTVGGMVGNNACGVHSLLAGRTSDNVDELEVLTYDGLRLRVGATTDGELDAAVAAGGRRGEVFDALRHLRDEFAGLIRSRYPDIPRRVSGYNLDELLPERGFHLARALVGTEGTCVTVLGATCRLVASPPARALAVLAYPDLVAAAEAVPEVLAFGPVGLEGMDGTLIDDMMARGGHAPALGLLPAGGAWLLVEFGGDTVEEAAAAGQRLVGGVNGRAGARLFIDPATARRVWEMRESAVGAASLVPGRPRTHEGWEDSAVAPDRLGPYIADLRRLLAAHRYRGSMYGHFGQGCLHVRIDFDLQTTEGVRRFRSFLEEAADLVVAHGGSLSGEHGDGQARGELLERMFGSELVSAFRRFKAVWDPAGGMNPGKVVDPMPLDAGLRLGPGFAPQPLATHFSFPDDGGSFSTATLRCIGVGKCRQGGGGTMCPSYMVTREEKHSTRGRAHLLHEMTRGDVVMGGWRDEGVKEALDLCLACKACKSECPVGVDVATYKAEFLAHYYRGRLRPLSAYAMGLVPWWLRLASGAPGLANVVVQSGPGGRVVKALGRVAPQRSLPRLARRTFRRSWRARPGRAAGGSRPPVLLWADTFTNHFDPAIADAAVTVLEAAGFTVELPQPRLCCGRPLYDAGMLPLAKRFLRRAMAAVGPRVEAGVPVVGLEPSCVAVFRDELVNLFPDEPRARALAGRVFTLAEFLSEHAPGFGVPRLAGHALVQRHCHHQAVMGFDRDAKLLAATGLDVEILDSGCCGMAGSFGFHRGDHYDVSIRAGERVLLPAVRQAGAETLVVADGFSCREQIRQATGRRALHLAEVLAAGLV